MIQPFTQNLTFNRNGVYRNNFLTLAGTPPIPVNLTGFLIAMEIRALPGAAGDPLVSVRTDLVSANGSLITVKDAPGSIFEVYVANGDIKNIPETLNSRQTAVSVYYDIVFHEPGGDFNPYWTGTVTVNEGVTRRWQT